MVEELICCSPYSQGVCGRETRLPPERFRDVITTESELQNVVGPANRWFTSKILTRLDRSCQRFIARSPFVLVASTGVGGRVIDQEHLSKRQPARHLPLFEMLLRPALDRVSGQAANERERAERLRVRR